ncbi:hypothetical protein EX30DRAFT_392458 [Ascodesmis nigricans]|uniref:TMEM14-domain-containing protein n=1 Tax=Ascodesmis nigricans TaxID=341454 RepID=A0A4S2N6W1_9PEZI|nr:hypothetical protein EX30DRAFT_392458 [Ascodesmis nigricans]
MSEVNPESTAYAIGALVALGGTMGYVRTKSVPSIAAGWLVGALYIAGGYRMNNGLPYGLETAIAASVILAGASLPRAIKTGKQVPVGLSALSLYGLSYYGRKALARNGGAI